MQGDKITVALVGLTFGMAFAPIYKMHPDVGRIVLCDTDPHVSKKAGDAFGIQDFKQSLNEVLNDPTIDAVHLVTPIPLHEEQSLAVLRAGKHCACTVPMATTLEGLRNIVAAVNQSGKNYMMMETSVYTQHYLYADQLLRDGVIGGIQFLRGAHYQDMEFWPDYWMGLPPMLYSTHAISPLLGLSGQRAQRVHCFGSGVMRDELKKRYNNPYPVETAIFDLSDGLSAEVTRSLFHTARMYSESFTLYGEKATFEWQQIENENPVLYKMEGRFIRDNGEEGRGRNLTYEKIALPDYGYLLPKEIGRFTVKSKFFDETNPQNAVEAGGGHGGSHPFMVHEFVRSIVENRKPWSNEITAADWTAPGICAHQSAMLKGKEVIIPDFN